MDSGSEALTKTQPPQSEKQYFYFIFSSLYVNKNHQSTFSKLFVLMSPDENVDCKYIKNK
jgi:hypothetical protein